MCAPQRNYVIKSWRSWTSKPSIFFRVKILLSRLDHLGDLMLMTPLIRALHKAGHEVDLLTLRTLCVLFEENPYLGKTFAVEDVVPSPSRNWWALGRWMGKWNYDVLLLPNPKPPQLLWSSLLSGVKMRLAMQAGMAGRLTGHRCLRMRESMMSGRHYSDLQLDFARALNIKTDGLKLDYFCRKEEIDEARTRISAAFPGFKGEPIIGIHPGSQGNTCNLPARVYGELVGLILARTNWRIIVTGSAAEKSLTDSWPRQILESPRVYPAMGAFNLRGLAATISQMNNYVIGSTGPLHLAAALGIQTTSPFCPLPPISAPVWGNILTGTCLGPKASCCQEWRKKTKTGHCDLRGEITAENLWQSLQAKTSR